MGGLRLFFRSASAVLLILAAAQGTSAALDSPSDSSPSAPPSPRAANPFSDPRYYYRASDNDPRLHPVPPEYKTGTGREHIWCYDWYRLARNGGKDWTYFLTTCECFSTETLKHFPPKPSTR
jgi:hypothetical protein